MPSDRWLNPAQPVLDQFVSKASTLVFKLRFITLNNAFLDTDIDHVALGLYYLQVSYLLLPGVCQTQQLSLGEAEYP